MKRSTLAILAGIFILTAGIGYGVVQMVPHRAQPVTDKSHVVELKSDHADPSAIAVIQGDYVQFNSKDGKTHNIGQGSGNDEVHQAAGISEHIHNYEAKESGAFGADEGYRVQFNKTGTFEFHDHLNPKISIVVIVYQSKK